VGGVGGGGGNHNVFLTAKKKSWAILEG
jgi:hypothetical protein